MMLHCRPKEAGAAIRRAFAAAPLLLCGCMASPPQAAEIVMPPAHPSPYEGAAAHAEAIAPMPSRRIHLKPHPPSVRSAGLALVPSGPRLDAYASVSIGGVLLPVSRPKVSFSFFDPSLALWEPIPNCQGVESCKIPFPWRSGRIRALFVPADPSVPAVSGELGYSNGSWTP